MEPIVIKVEPDFEGLPIKIEPPDESDSNFECFYDKDIFKYETEIKEEEEDISENEQDESMSPMSSSYLSPSSPESTCRVIILEQPLKKLRFRYLSELQGTPHGPLLGERSTKNRKTFPKVKLVGYEGKEQVKMRCWLVDVTDNGTVRPHCHDLVVRKCSPKSDIVPEPHEVVISRDNQFTAEFENMVVLHNVQKESESKYLNKEIKWISRGTTAPVCFPKLDKKKIREKIKSINKNEVYLYFEAYIEFRTSELILNYALSNPIKNLKNPVSGDLKICRVLNSIGPSDGNTEVALFTERVLPDVKIKISSKEKSWVQIVSPEFMHRNIALTFKTPKFPFDIDDNFAVDFCLYRDSDEAVSNSFPFVYQPSAYDTYGSKKRRLDDLSSSQMSASPSSLGENDDSNSFSGPFNDVFNALSTEDIDSSDCLMLSVNALQEEFNGNAYFLGEDVSEEFPIDLLLRDGLGDSEAVRNFSGTSILEELKSDPLINGNSAGRSDITTDGVDSPTYSNVILCSMNTDSSYNVRRNTFARIVKDILLTAKYNHHINLLQKAVINDRVDVVKKILNSIKLISSRAADNQMSKFLTALPIQIIRIRNQCHQTLLHTAVLLKRDTIIQPLLEFGYNPLDKDRNGNNAFHLAVGNSRSTLKTLIVGSIETGVKPVHQRKDKKLPPSVLSIYNFEGHNILHLAVRSLSFDMLKYVVSLKMIDINSSEINSGDSALHIACRLHALAIAEHLIQNGADICMVNLQGYSPLHLSVSRNDHEMVTFLIKEKGNPNQECLSLIRELGSKEMDDELTEDSGTYDRESSHEGENYSSLDAFSLANDLMMVDILSGKMGSFKLSEELEEKPSKTSRKGENLLTSDQVEKLSAILRDKNCWRDLIKSLSLDRKYPHLEEFIGGFKEPEKMLLNRINNQKDEILEQNDQLGQFVDGLKSLNLTEAVDVMLSKDNLKM